MKPKIYLSTAVETAQYYINALTLAGAEAVDDPEKADGLLVPGGADVDPALYGCENAGSVDFSRAEDERELRLIRRFLDEKKPILGICRGSQLLCTALGGTLRQHIEGHTPISETEDRLHPAREEGWMAELYGPRCTINSRHHQSVDRLPEGCTAVQWADDGIIEAFSHNALPVIAVQWHPERLSGDLRRPGAVNGVKVFEKFISLFR